MTTTIAHPAPELLAPAGDRDALRAAVANGADAVYFGLHEFNARHRAHNFSLDDLPGVMSYLHSHNVRGFLTFNILIFSDELEAALEHLKEAAAAGVDAVIVQDLGLVRLIKRALPELEVHGSTQMTLTEPRGIDFVRGLGVERVVLARELSVMDIGKIRAATDVPVEVFVHGALCVSYSGQCLTSEALGGRSANRGQCAQACRLPYDLIVDDQQRDLGDVAYLLSPQDLAAYDVVKELTELGVASFKIEGRLKNGQYVAATCQTYRAAIDAALGPPEQGRRFEATPQQRADLAQSFSRGFSHGFLSGVNHQVLVEGTYSKKRGIRIGEVARVLNDRVIVTVDPGVSLQIGDGVVFQGADQNNEIGGRVSRLRPRPRNGSSEVELTLHEVDPSRIPGAGAVMWKTDDPAIRKRLESSYGRDVTARPARVDFIVEATVGEPLRITARDEAGRAETITADQPLELARKHPLTVDVLREQLGRLGGTPFAPGSIELRVDGEAVSSSPAMVPKSLINDLRRIVIERLAEMRVPRVSVVDEDALRNLRAEIAKPQAAEGTPTLHVMVRTLAQLRALLDLDATGTIYCDFEDVRQYKEAVALGRLRGRMIAPATTRIIKPGEEGLLNNIATSGAEAILVRNLAAISFFRGRYPHIQLIGDYTLNIANELTAQLFAEQGLARLTPSYDLSFSQLAAMCRHYPPAPGMFEVVIHQHMPMFHTEHCVFAHTLSNGGDYRTCGRPCDDHTVSLRDRVGIEHPLVPDVGCRNTVYNGTAQSGAEFVPRMKQLGLQHFRIELLRETPEEVAPLVSRYARILAGEEDPQTAWRSLKVLNQLGVTRGTLADG